MPAPLLSVAGEYQAAALNCQMRFVDSANDDNETYLLALSVQSGGGLVQEQDLGVANDRSGDGNALLLATRQLRTLGADVCVVFLRREGRRAALNVLNVRSFWTLKRPSPLKHKQVITAFPWMQCVLQPQQ